MWQKDFGILSNEYANIVISDMKAYMKKNISHISIMTALLVVLQSDTPQKPTEKTQDIPRTQSTQYRYHDGFILPPLSHEE